MSKNKKIIVIPLAGLGNRMRMLSSCIQIAKRDNRTVWIVWPIDSDLGCDIYDIFKSVGVEYSVPPKLIHYILTKIYRIGAIKKYYKFYKLFSKLFSDSSIFDDDIWKANRQLNVNQEVTTILVASCLAFNEQDFKLFKFTDYLELESDREYKKIGNSYIGIHIRRTDHVNATMYSPDQNYLAQINSCIQNNPEQKFFLATDDWETKKYFEERYEKLIYTLDLKLGRKDLEGIHGAIIELILLSRSKKIICSAISSYSTAAVLLGDIRETIFVDTFLDQNQMMDREAILKHYQNL